MRMIAVLKNREHPEYGELSLPLPIKASEYDHTMDMLAGKVCRELPGAIMNQKGLGLEAQQQPPVEQNLLEHALPSMQDNETAYYIFHCGYVDADLFRVSSLTVRRAIDLDAALSSRIKDYIRKHQIELITYREL